MFNFDQFVKLLRQDNSTYERFKRSSLHDLVELLRPPTASAQQLSAAIRKIPVAKWRKYPKAKTYLLAEFPGLQGQLKGYLAEISGFHTVSMRATAGGFIEHSVHWRSSTGHIEDLSHILTREHVSWGAPPPAAKPLLHAEYQKPGQHYGVGNNATMPGDKGPAKDTHHAAGPFQTPAASRYSEGPPVSLVLEQEYQYSDDGGKTWHTFPNSKFILTRRVDPGPVFTIKKSGQGREARAEMKL